MIKQIEIEMLSDTVNCPVIRIPGRKFPGVVLQGDSLKALFDAAVELSLLCKEKGEDISISAVELKDRLACFVDAYEIAMDTHQLQLPYLKK